MLLFKFALCSLFAISLAEPLSSFFNIKDSLKKINTKIEDKEDDLFENYKQTQLGIEFIKEDTDELTSQLSNKASSSFKSFGNMAGNMAGSMMGKAKQGVQLAKDTATKATKYTSDMLKSITGAAVNNGAKLFISQLTRFLKAINMDDVKLPPISHKQSLMGGWAEVAFDADGGHFGKLSSLQQHGPITFGTNKTSLYIDIPLTVSNLTIGYDEYRLSGFKLSTNGYFGVSVKSNGLKIKLRLYLDIKCILNVEQLEITDMDGIEVQFEGLCTGCGTLVGYVSSQVANIVGETIKVKLQETLDEELKKYVDAYPGLCAGFLSK